MIPYDRIRYEIFTLPPGRGVEYCDEFVCLCIISQEPHFKLYEILHTAHNTCSRLSRLWWPCNTLYAFGFVDDIVF